MNSNHPTSAPRRLPRRITVASIVALTVLAAPAESETLRGRLSGLEAPDSRFDLQLRFFAPGALDRVLAERRFDDIDLEGGHFLVPLDADTLPPGELQIQLGLRPAERRYALFRVIPPRRRLVRVDDQRWAVVPIDEAASGVAQLDRRSPTEYSNRSALTASFLTSPMPEEAVTAIAKKGDLQ